MLSSKLWIVRICIAVSVLVMFTLSTHVWEWCIRITNMRMSTHWELIFLYLLLYAISGMLLGLRAEVFLNFRNVRFKPFNFIILGIIPIVYLVLFVGATAGYWSYRILLYSRYTNLFVIFSSIWLGVAAGKAFYICE